MRVGEIMISKFNHTRTEVEATCDHRPGLIRWRVQTVQTSYRISTGKSGHLDHLVDSFWIIPGTWSLRSHKVLNVVNCVVHLIAPLLLLFLTNFIIRPTNAGQIFFSCSSFNMTTTVTPGDPRWPTVTPGDPQTKEWWMLFIIKQLTRKLNENQIIIIKQHKSCIY